MNDAKHKKDVAHIASQVREFFNHKRPFRIFHGSTNSTRILSFKRNKMLDMSGFDRVLSVNKSKQTAIVEPNVPMDALVNHTLKHGLLPPVVMEFPGITVGGGIQGGAGESSSYKWGCFNQTFNWYEMVLADGKVMKVSPTNNADLFYGTAGSYGTLGVMTAGEIQLIPARKYVRLTYIPVDSFETSVKMLDKVIAENHDFIDGIMFARDRGVIIVGDMTDEATGHIQRFSRARDQWFYLHAQDMMQDQPTVETVPITDYLFRYDRGAFWVGRFAFELFNVAFTRFNRWLLNPILHTRKLYQALQESGASQQHVVQDLALPRGKAVKFMEFVDSTLDVYPLWLCPLRPDNQSPLQSNNLDTQMVINVGVWGSHIESYDEFLAANRSIEKQLKKLGGKKWFYAHSYYSEREFWNIYDKPAYDTLRAKYHATSLPTIFDKIRVTERSPINVKRGLFKTIFGRAKLKIRD